MPLFSRRTATATAAERDLPAEVRLGLAPWRAEMLRVGLGEDEPVFVANNDGGSILSAGRRFAVTPEIGVVMLTPLRVAYLHRLGDGIASAVADLSEVGGLSAERGSVEVRVGE